VIIPSILAVAFLGLSMYLDPLADSDLLPLVMWIAANGSYLIELSGTSDTVSKSTLVVISLTMSMTVNAMVTSLIVFRIFKVIREVQRVTTSEETSLGARGRKLRSIIFIIIESGMVLFAIQLVRLITELNTGPSGNLLKLFAVTVGIHQMLGVIISRIFFTALYFTDNANLDRA
jgi:hypothetical protein